MKIMFVVVLMCLFIVMCSIFYIFGMIKGYKNLLKTGREDWGRLDSALYETLTREREKKLDTIVLSRIGELRLEKFKDNQKIIKRKKMTKSKEVNKKKLKNK
tara:strand:+ start:1527 stop:1832 length:306 start_codon:yes stop_codon:yes gene_type:complete